MSDPLIDSEDEAATPLKPEEREALIPSYITQRRELNEAEHIGVAGADQWAFARKRDVLSEAFLRRLHWRMFEGVWKWAGEFRTTPRNIGVEAWQIGPRLHQLLGDVRYWIQHRTFAPDEIAVRFHHRLVFIHPFPNGNGRLARLAADLLIVNLDGERFSWGSGNLTSIPDLRRRYIDALRAADREAIEPLIAFARS
ncbi:MAG: mobile mystery protein B [Caulobacteraceae bacterium]|nr:mobile mystery protein B [Caulobacteraceae bacterium]